MKKYLLIIICVLISNALIAQKPTKYVTSQEEQAKITAIAVDVAKTLAPDYDISNLKPVIFGPDNLLSGIKNLPSYEKEREKYDNDPRLNRKFVRVYFMENPDKIKHAKGYQPKKVNSKVTHSPVDVYRPDAKLSVSIWLDDYEPSGITPGDGSTGVSFVDCTYKEFVAQNPDFRLPK